MAGKHSVTLRRDLRLGSSSFRADEVLSWFDGPCLRQEESQQREMEDIAKKFIRQQEKARKGEEMNQVHFWGSEFARFCEG